MIGIFVDPPIEHVQFVDNCCFSLYESLGLEIFEEGGMHYTHTGADSPILNGVIKGKVFQKDPFETVRKIVAYFEAHRLPHSWWITDETDGLKKALADEGFVLLGGFPGMVLDLENAPQHEPSGELTIEQIHFEEEMREWSHVIAGAFEFSPSVCVSYQKLFETTMDQGDFIHLIGKKEGVVVATGSVLFSGDGAYLFNIATHEGYRNRGYGTDITYALVQLAREHHCSKIGLISSPIAASVYSRLGFKRVKEYRIYVLP